MAESRDVEAIKAEIDPQVLPYKFWLVFGIMCITVVGILGLPFWAIIYHVFYKPRYYEFHSLTLTERTAEIVQGIVFRRRTNIPYDRITDVSVEQGPLMRRFGIHKVTMETAGQTQMEGTASMYGVVDPEAFREKVLDNVESMRMGAAGPMAMAGAGAGEMAAGSGDVVGLLTEIRDTIQRIEESRGG